MIIDLGLTVSRVVGWISVSYIAGVCLGLLIHRSRTWDICIGRAVEFIRHIAPFAWLPFAIGWFGLGERSLGFIMFISLALPATIGAREAFQSLPGIYREEASLCGAGALQSLIRIDLPLAGYSLVTVFRLLWGAAWQTVIVGEMLGVSGGLGFRLLDARYLMDYETMILIMLIIGAIGFTGDLALRKVAAGLPIP
jgi:NitT/TauT family transport system permease protein